MLARSRRPYGDEMWRLEWQWLATKSQALILVRFGPKLCEPPLCRLNPGGTRIDTVWVLVLASISGIMPVGEACVPLELQGTCIGLDSEADGACN